ncbi:adenomatous polyposis coli homolog [Venturia canescens]|uniref:adenomatous polyposis coli homolog n=1 Tax=Venturia canescens TaxID=32260 RepID=UPI001C9C1E41|nr:adenomatous polyposis coli homolog [Venturia canescens]XP_043275086.1 adenomatous polyposis coli homolog [Venturia canescens]
MSSASSSNPGMGRTSREKNPREGIKAEPNADPTDSEGPMDLSMPRYGNRKKDTRSSNCYFVAGRRKQPSSYDVDANEQPIDYSKKYVESNAVSAVKTNYVPRNSLNKVKIDHREREKGFSQQDNKAYPYGVYAETDLDQPTDYSLRYAEDDTDDEEKQSDAYFNGNEQEDTVKTYCTEGTPYETPFNVSSATSMSDLRLEETKDGEGLKRTGRKNVQDPRKEITVKQPPPCEELEEEKEEESEILTKESKNISNELVLNSSSTSIEKPVNYYDEGTPGRISRVSSLSSLGCTNEPRNEDIKETPEGIQAQTPTALPVSPISTVNQCTNEIENAENLSIAVADTMNDEEAAISGMEEEKGDARSVDKEGKVVTFGGEDHYAEQTPLMFSRSSSLGSLSGFEQHSIHDDRSSIVSDFSRRTSGVVSPSELPDSPTQTVPPSPRHNQKNNTNDFSNRAPPLRHFSYAKNPRSKSSVFEDNITAFKEESTPLEFSAATSLSSLTIDDEPKILMDTKEKDYTEEARTVEQFLVNTSNEVESVEGNEVKSKKEEHRDSQIDRTNPDETSDGDEDDEDILAACISMGMRNSMYKQSNTKIAENSENTENRTSSGDSTTNLVRYETSSTLDCLVADVAAVSLSPCAKIKNSIDVVVPLDTVRVYCTEDTPASISPVGSLSNLSALSMLSISGDIEKDDRNRLSEESDDDKILDDCIRVGIERSLRGANRFSGSASVTELSSPSHVVESKKCHDDEKILDHCAESGGAKSMSRSNSFSETASVTKNPSPLHIPSMKKSELHLPCLLDSRKNFSMISPLPSQNSETPSCHTSSRQNPDCVNQNASNYDDKKILEECTRAGITRSVHGANSFPGTAAVTRFNSPSHGASTGVGYDSDQILEDCIKAGMARGLQGSSSLPSTAVPTKHHSPRHVPTTKKSQLHLSKFIENRQVFSMSPPASVAAKYDYVRQLSTDTSNSISVDHDTSGDDDKILDDCIRAGIARTLGGRISFPTNSAKHHSPRHIATSKTSRSQVPRSTDNRQVFSGSKSSPTKSKANSSNFDRDTWGDDDKMLDECIRAGMARTMHGTNSFPGSALGTKSNSPRHTSSTRKYHDENKTSDDSIRFGIPRTPHGSNSFPGTPVATKHNSPRHSVSIKKSEAYSPRVNDPRRGYSIPSSSPAKRNDVADRRMSSARSNISAVDHDTSGDEDKILDDCIKVGTARTLQGAVSFPNTATKHHSPRHASATKKCQEYSAKQAFSTSSQSPSKSRDASSRRIFSNRTNSTVVDHDTSGDDDKMLDECIKVGIARTLQGAVLFPSTVTVPKTHSPRHVSSVKKSEAYSTRNVDSRQNFSMPVPSSPQTSGGSSSHNIPCSRSNPATLDFDTSGDEDKILDDCIKVGIARTLHGTITFPSNVTKSHSPRRGPLTKKTEIYSSSNADSRQGRVMRSPSRVKSNGSSIGRTSSPRSHSNHDHISYDQSPNQSEDEAILAKCAQTAMSKECRNSLSFSKPQISRKIPKPMARVSNPESPCSSTRVTTEVFRTSVTTILIPARHRGEECFGDNSSISEEEEDLMLAQCIRSGMPTASSMPSKNSNYQREERRTREQ